MAPQAQADHLKAQSLSSIFQKKIAKSQATGKDGVRINRFADRLDDECRLIERKILAGTYSFTTFKERLILRGSERVPRQISIPTVRDRLTLRALCQIMHTHQAASVGPSPHSIIGEVLKAIRSEDQAKKSFVRLDVRNFFPSLSHSILAREMKFFGFDDLVVNLIRSAITTPTGASNAKPSKGVPQGLSISGALSALYMLRFDEKRKSENPLYFRYVDDILLICETAEADELLNRMSRSLRARGLAIHKKGVAGKTEISPVPQGIDFLGYRVSVEKVSVRESSYHRMFKNLLKVITDYRYNKNTERFLFRINLKISGCIVDGRRRGWMMFFSQTEDVSQLAYLDTFLQRQLIRVNFPKDQAHRIKKYVKSYHEIKYNLASSQYIPNFDNFEFQQKAEVVAVLSRKDLSAVLAMDALVVEAEFSRYLSKEVHDLEQDVGNPS